MDYRLYEKLKHKLQSKDLTPAEYEHAIKAILEVLEEEKEEKIIFENKTNSKPNLYSMLPKRQVFMWDRAILEEDEHEKNK